LASGDEPDDSLHPTNGYWASLDRRGGRCCAPSIGKATRLIPLATLFSPFSIVGSFQVIPTTTVPKWYKMSLIVSAFLVFIPSTPLFSLLSPFVLLPY
jgi:hypothetical protein